MDETYELTRKQGRYNSMKENIIHMINVLYNEDVCYHLSLVETSLKNNYLINDLPVKYSKIKEQKNHVSESLNILRNILNEANSSIDNIKQDIIKADENNKEDGF